MSHIALPLRALPISTMLPVPPEIRGWLVTSTSISYDASVALPHLGIHPTPDVTTSGYLKLSESFLLVAHISCTGVVWLTHLTLL